VPAAVAWRQRARRAKRVAAPLQDLRHRETSAASKAAASARQRGWHDHRQQNAAKRAWRHQHRVGGRSKMNGVAHRVRKKTRRGGDCASRKAMASALSKARRRNKAALGKSVAQRVIGIVARGTLPAWRRQRRRASRTRGRTSWSGASGNTSRQNARRIFAAWHVTAAGGITSYHAALLRIAGASRASISIRRWRAWQRQRSIDETRRSLRVSSARQASACATHAHSCLGISLAYRYAAAENSCNSCLPLLRICRAGYFDVRSCNVVLPPCRHLRFGGVYFFAAATLPHERTTLTAARAAAISPAIRACRKWHCLLWMHADAAVPDV